MGRGEERIARALEALRALSASHDEWALRRAIRRWQREVNGKHSVRLLKKQRLINSVWWPALIAARKKVVDGKA